MYGGLLDRQQRLNSNSHKSPLPKGVLLRGAVRQSRPKTIPPTCWKLIIMAIVD